jgi:hypothetical protein
LKSEIGLLPENLTRFLVMMLILARRVRMKVSLRCDDQVIAMQLTEIDKFLEPEFDFSQINPEEFEWMGNVTPHEIEQAFRNHRTVFYDCPQIPFKLPDGSA